MVTFPICQCGKPYRSLSSSSLTDHQIEAQKCCHPSCPVATGRLSLDLKLTDQCAYSCGPQESQVLRNQYASEKNALFLKSGHRNEHAQLLK